MKRDDLAFGFLLGTAFGVVLTWLLLSGGFAAVRA